jgi:transketolase
MRDAFVRALTDLAAGDQRVVLLTADLGYKLFDEFERCCPDRFFNVGVAEANMISVAAGLALDGRRPFVYSIVPFVTARCIEQIRIDLCEMELPVTVVGVGGGYAYGPNGPTHHGVDDVGMMRSLPGMTVLAPCDPRETAAATAAAFDLGGPVYLRLGRANEAIVNGTDRPFKIGKPTVLREGHTVAMLASGSIATEALAAADSLASGGMTPAVLSVHTLKPLGSIVDCIRDFTSVFVIEEHGPHGGLYEALSGELFQQGRWCGRLHRISAPDRFHRLTGSSHYLRSASGLDARAIAATVARDAEQGHR